MIDYKSAREPLHKQHGWPMPTGPAEPVLEHGQDEQYDLVEDGPDHIERGAITNVYGSARRDDFNPNTYEPGESHRGTNQDIVAALLDVAHAFDGAAVRVRPSARFVTMQVVLQAGQSLRILGEDSKRTSVTIVDIAANTTSYVSSEPISDGYLVDGVQYLTGHPIPSASVSAGLILHSAGEMFVAAADANVPDAVLSLLIEYQD